MSTTPNTPKPIPNFWTSYVPTISLYTIPIWILLTCLTLFCEFIYRQAARFESQSSTWFEGFWSTAGGIAPTLVGALLAVVTMELVKQRRREKVWRDVGAQGTEKE